MEISKSLSQAAPPALPAPPQQEDHLAAWQNAGTKTALCSFFLHISTCFLNVPLPLVVKVRNIPPEPVRHYSARLHFGLFQFHAPAGDLKRGCVLAAQTSDTPERTDVCFGDTSLSRLFKPPRQSPLMQMEMPASLFAPRCGFSPGRYMLICSVKKLQTPKILVFDPTLKLIWTILSWSGVEGDGF